MTLNQIKYMVKVAEYGSINKVASMSFVSQSVISTAIKNLEQELGRSLFIRTAKRFLPISHRFASRSAS